ncbi:cation diffusion facilitator family transporter [Enterococcus sp. DIV0876]|uniref:cation diffusion facilitator family transporter n=1 Tax=Enterococcus sp. DIV0876 TaxID=2774633 RepID=UPI003D3017CD
MNQARYDELKKAEKGATISIVAYIVVSVAKLLIGRFANSEALWADGLNNATDIIASIAVFIGLRVAQKPADKEHKYGHWKAENVASLVTSLIMLAVGVQVLISSIQTIIAGETESPDMIAAMVGIISALLMYGVYFYNKTLAAAVKSSALLAAAKDNRSDAWTSIGTAIAIFAASFGLGWLDSLTAIVVALLIVKTAVDIFRESAFSLSDGFDDTLVLQYEQAIATLPEVLFVKSIRGRMYGANVFVDVVIAMEKTLTVEESHQVADEIEVMLAEQFQVFDTDVHIEPA